jgi:hypothetical protein
VGVTRKSPDIRARTLLESLPPDHLKARSGRRRKPIVLKYFAKSAKTKRGMDTTGRINRQIRHSGCKLNTLIMLRSANWMRIAGSQLRLDIKYLMFDLEVTRRERDALRDQQAE